MTEKNIKEKRLAELKASLLSVEGRNTEVYSRIVGYYRSVKNWNAGKKEEFRFRKEYGFPAWDASATVTAAPVIEEQNESGAGSTAGASSYLLFTRRACPNCPPVKEYLLASGLSGALLDTDTESGMDMARKYEVLATPTAILLDNDGKELTRCYTRAQLMVELAPVTEAAQAF